MNEFTASNDRVLTEKNGTILVHAVGDPVGAEKIFVCGPLVTDALREKFQAEEDKRLGRWRYPKDTRYVVYPISDDEVRVLDEETGATFNTRRPTREYLAEHLNHALGAANAYFKAHSEPKPWHDAREGEVWVVTSGIFHAEPVFAVEYAEEGMSFTNYQETTQPITDADITAGTRIYPEVE